MNLLVVTDRGQAAAAGRALIVVVAAAIEGGARSVVLREKDLPRQEREVLAKELQGLLAPVGGSLLVAGDGELAAGLGGVGVGVHLAAGQPVPDDGVAGPVGRSCHDLAELRSVQADGLDYATLSPIWETPSKPGYGPALGPEGLAAACAAVPGLAVYALGGVRPDRVAACRDAGAAGVAVMGEVMRAEDPAEAVRTLLEAWS